MIAPWRKLVLVLIMLWLPLQGAMAATMSLCLKDKEMSIGRLDTPTTTNTPEAPGASVPAIPGMLPCAGAMNAAPDTQEIPDPEQTAGTGDAGDAAHESVQGIGESTPIPKCDGTPCQASCTAPIPSAASTTLPGDGASYAVLFNSRFTLLVLEQLQRPPLA
ncbi:hypothetical protein [Nitrosospira sp. Is2]|uniref:hypothetical protein n=1 Tax=Nitrosospira sp. Is2 TaxID=3080532 RepID=UPI002954918B|nr:hypothetical protein [Nitrosospira sp. Is2]WON73686.1 hypothetical protein R5L00_14580 [Nitrosospira sp. Is2]